MRTNCSWFTERATLTWNAKRGRSILVLVPQGCDEIETSLLIRQWTERNFIPPSPYDKNTPLCISLTTDSMVSCDHFAQTFAKRFTRLHKLELYSDPEDYPTDVIQNTVETLLAAGYYPIVAIERFHAFALINDPGMTSVLSGMRSLEMSGQLTTLSFSPLTYAMIRRLMQPGLPFLNSVYGDNHDQIVMTPLARTEFVEYATSQGISANKSNALYPKGGGPDAVYKALIDCSDLPENEILEACLVRTEETLDKFLTKSFIGHVETDRPLMTKLALGRLYRQEIPYILSNPLHLFLAKETDDGNLVCSSQILARKILRGDQPKWQVYDLCLNALSSCSFHSAAEIISTINDSDPRLVAFKEVVLLRASMQPKLGIGLLGVDWTNIIHIAKRISDHSNQLPAAIKEWISQCQVKAKLVTTYATGSLNRLQLDSLTSSSSNVEIRRLTLSALGNYLKLSQELSSPPQRILHLVNIPEAILQAISCGFCEINFIKYEDKHPSAPYDKFFASPESFKVPSEGSKLTLTALLVMVPTILSLNDHVGCEAFVDEKHIKTIQQKLVECVRNPASHTIVAFLEKDASFLYELCLLWIDSWSKMEGYDNYESFSLVNNHPSPHDISSIILG
ncbi:hypothetical protein ALP73_02675 [Pseudomonas coronafaciens pv. garcae]|uniref:Novel STAND NTPase 2 domain-containing protein n=1 Tax=Pseudomonas tremae TaxID=200454 RepID=A0ABV4PIM6_9PSED|nr:hypothetical protein ALP73_02675 [Pseudomonas coronafaciens pv. garcae]